MTYSTLDPSECDFYEVAAADELPNGERLFVEIGENFLVIFNIAGQIYAIEDLCSHDDGPLGDGDLEDHEIICPRHGARFDVRDGKALTLPAVEAIPAYPVQVVDGQIRVGLPKE
ncbi:MAG TPA: biphenyl 2,3-dioxygenase [Chloroflexi bacterium]|nr:biphenyl 2,3-dioxygenase [Chloroflexota bacterium]